MAIGRVMRSLTYGVVGHGLAPRDGVDVDDVRMVGLARHGGSQSTREPQGRVQIQLKHLVPLVSITCSQWADW